MRRLVMLDRWIQSLAPPAVFAEGAAALLDLMGRAKDLRPRLKGLRLFLAGFVAIDFCGDDDVAKRNILDASSNADEKRQTRVKMSDRPFDERGRCCIAGPSLGDDHIVISKTAPIKN